MAQVYVDFPKLQDIPNELGSLVTKLQGVYDSFTNAMNGLDWDVKAEQNINNTANRLLQKIDGYGSALSGYKQYLYEAFGVYINLDNNQAPNVTFNPSSRGSEPKEIYENRYAHGKNSIPVYNANGDVVGFIPSGKPVWVEEKYTDANGNPVCKIGMFNGMTDVYVNANDLGDAPKGAVNIGDFRYADENNSIAVYDVYGNKVDEISAGKEVWVNYKFTDANGVTWAQIGMVNGVAGLLVKADDLRLEKPKQQASNSGMSSAENIMLIRTEVPTKTSTYYGSANPFTQAGFGMFDNKGNCTAYAWGRAYEISGSRPTLSTSNAKDWFGNTSDGYERGYIPKPGAVVCWSGGSTGSGHVAVVEEVYPDGSYLVSESLYQSTLFKTRVVKDNLHTNNHKFQGFIYIN